MFDVGLYFPLLSYVEFYSLLRLEEVNHQFCVIIRGSEPTWRASARYLFHDKLFVPRVVLRFIHEGNTIYHRKDLFEMPIRQLKHLARFYAVNITKCFEKSEIVNAIHCRETRRRHSDECMARFAVRVAYVDKSRNTITDEELCEVTWCIRIRQGGRLSHMIQNDPWWTGKPKLEKGTTTTVRFHPNGTMEFDTHGPSPFFGLIMHHDEVLTYFTKEGGRVVQLSLGVGEVAFRHPVNWGFLLGSEGTVWTGYSMPPLGEDPVIEDPQVQNLRNQKSDFGFCL